MYHKRLIKEPLNLINSSMLIGSMSEPEQVIAGAIQTLTNQKQFYIEFPINYEKDSPRIDFLIEFYDKKKCAIEVNGFQHFSLYSFKSDQVEYKNQWIRYLEKIKWCEKNKIPMIHINILYNTQNLLKEFRNSLYNLISSNMFQKAITTALITNSHVSINITKSGLLNCDPVKSTDSYMENYINQRIKGIVLGKNNPYTITITI